MNKELKIEKMQSFLWDSFCDSDAVGVKLDDLLTWPGLHLSSDQVAGVEHYYYDPEAWREEQEAVKEIVANNTDCEDFDRLYSWLIWTVGDQTAAELMESWGEK